jgi:hypothetical protein
VWQGFLCSFVLFVRTLFTMKVCNMCDRDYMPASRTQRFCSRSCAQSYRQAVAPHRQGSGPKPWAGKSPEAQQAYGTEYRKVRDRVVAAAIATGARCPGCGRLLTRENCQADHVVARAEGGSSSPGNLRAVCESCNRLRGAALGGRVTKARRAARGR